MDKLSKDKLNSLSLEQRQALLTLIGKKQKSNSKENVETNIRRLAREEGDNLFPVSFAQKRLWFINQLKPDSIEYNVPFAYCIKGKLNIATVKEAIRQIIERHEVWRTVFKEVDGEPMQVVCAEAKVNLYYEDLARLEASKKDERAFDIAKQDSKCVFNLEEGPLVNFTLIQKSEEEYIFLVVAHHIAIDSWSIDIFKNEFTLLYESLEKGNQIELPALEIQYADYAVWQKEKLKEKDIQEQVAYWKNQLAGKIETLNMPTDYKRPDIKGFAGDAYSFDISKELSVGIKKIAMQNQCTPFMVLLAAYQVLLYRYTGRDRVVVGSSIATRQTKETENLLGFFVNNLVFNSEIGDNPTFSQYLKRVRDDVIGAYGHQDIPFEKLVEELKLPRDLSRTPVFQVMFNYLNVPSEEFSIKEMQLEPFNLGGSKSSVDLDLFAWEKDGFTHFNLEYNTDLYKRSTITRLSKQYTLLLESITQFAHLPVTELAIIPQEEKEKVLYEWNPKKLDKQDLLTLHGMIEKQVEKSPNSIALSFEGRDVTYQELNEQANQLAHYLLEMGITPETKIGLFIDRSVDIVIAMLGVLKAGGTYVPLDPIYPKERVQAILEAGSVSIVLAQRILLANFPVMPSVKLLCIDTLLQEVSGGHKQNPRVILEPNHLMYILFTSGSTGEPKGVMVEHRNYRHYIQGITRELGIDTPMQFAIASTFAADLGTTNIFVPLTTGGRVHIISYERATDPDKFAAYFKEHTIDVMKLVPSHFEALQIAEDPQDIVPKKIIIFAGEVCTWEAVAKVRKLNPNCRIFNNYGPTETTVSILAYEVGDVRRDAIHSVPLGRPIYNSSVYILDKNKEPVPIGAPGELYIGGNGVTRGYLDQEELTNEKFILNPFSKNNSDRLYCTGDIVRYLDSGDIEFIGRADRQVKIRGYRIELSGVEQALKQHDLVEEAIAVVVTDGSDDKRLVAYITVSKDTQTFKTSELRKYLKTRLPEYMIPVSFIKLDTIPLNTNGKIDYKALPAPDSSMQSEEESYIAPRNAFETEIAAIWCEILGVRKVGIDDNFFDLGGESFKAIKVTRKIGKNVSVIDLFKYPTIRELSEKLMNSPKVESGRLVELTRSSKEDKLVNLICFPFAGASAVAFQPLANELPPHCALYGVRLPGHDFSNPEDIEIPYETILKECLQEIKEKVKGPVAVYAQCVVGALGLGLVYLLEAEGIEVISLFEAGNFPSPRLPGKFFDLWVKFFPSDRAMSDRVYRETLRSLGNADETDNKEEEDFIIRGIRYDARQAEDYFSANFYKKDLNKIKTPICCIVGERDRTTEFYEERYYEWGTYSDEVSLKVIENAGHFFQKYQAKELSGIIVEQVMMITQPDFMSKIEAANIPETLETADELSASEKHYKGKKEPVPSLKLFLFIIVGQLVSIIGSNIAGFALGVWIFQKTGSIGQFSIIAVCGMLPGILLAPIAGAVADRWDKRTIMIVSDLFGVLGTVVILTAFLNGGIEVLHICIAAVLGSTGSTFQRPAFLSAIPQIVPKQYIGQASGMIQLSMSAGEMLGPILGALLIVGLGLKGIIILDLLSCAASVGTLLIVRFPKTLFKKREEGFLKEITGGWRYIIQRQSFVVMVIFFLVANFLMSIITILFMPLISSFTDTKVLGMVLAANAAGVVIGSIIMSLWGGTKRRADGMVGYLILTGISMVMMGLRPSPVIAGIGLFLFGFSIAFIDTHWQIIIQTKVGLELQGRVFAINQMLVSVLRPFAFLLAAPFCNILFKSFLEGDSFLANGVTRIIGAGQGREIGLAFIVVGIILTIWAYLGFNYRALRYMEDVLPDTIPGGVILKDKDKLQMLAASQSKSSQIKKSIKKEIHTHIDSNFKVDIE